MQQAVLRLGLHNCGCGIRTSEMAGCRSVRGRVSQAEASVLSTLTGEIYDVPALEVALHTCLRHPCTAHTTRSLEP